MHGGTSRPRIVVATRSTHKLRELRELLHPAVAELISLDDAGVPHDVDPVEDGATFDAALAQIRETPGSRPAPMPG